MLARSYFLGLGGLGIWREWGVIVIWVELSDSTLCLPCVRVRWRIYIGSRLSGLITELLDRPQETTNQLNYSVIQVCRMFTQGKLLCDNNSTHGHWPREPRFTVNNNQWSQNILHFNIDSMHSNKRIIYHVYQLFSSCSFLKIVT